MLDKQSGGSGCGDGDEGWHEVSDFCYRIYYYHCGVVSLGFWKFDNEVYTDGVPRDVGDRKRSEFTNWFVPPGFGVEAQVTGRHVFPNIMRHLWPPVIPGYKF